MPSALTALTAVTAEAAGGRGGGLTVNWTIEGDDVSVEVAVGPDPGSIDRSGAVTTDPATRSIHLVELPPGRPYVAVTPVGGGKTLYAAPRRVDLEGPVNFRDLGGLPTTGGRHTRWGLVFRSDALSRLTARDQLLFGQMGIRTVFDLRGEEERERSPNPFRGAEVTTRTYPLIGSRSRSFASVAGTLDAGEDFLFDLYRHMASDSALLLGSILNDLSDPDALPAVFHCAGGKDRTGLTAALLLTLLDVPLGHVLDDYVLTSAFLSQDRLDDLVRRVAGEGISPEAAAGLFGVPRWAMERTLAEVVDRHGSIETYLAEAGGMQPEAFDRLRRNLLV
ncbi:MAG TPA: tyrosine-protein phosphatase [Acidimicrobiales bacterium]|nr:tyrosine-protein phosphatase [Acidimicrobiales bacterium]